MTSTSPEMTTHPGISRKIFAGCCGILRGIFHGLRGELRGIRGESRGKFRENPPKFCETLKKFRTNFKVLHGQNSENLKNCLFQQIVYKENKIQNFTAKIYFQEYVTGNY